MARILVKHRRSSWSSWAKFVRTPTCWSVEKTFCWRRDGKKYRIGNVIFLWNEGLFLSENVDDILLAGLVQNMALIGRNWWKMLILTNQLHFLTTKIWDALNVNANRTKSLLSSTQKCLNHEFLLEQLKNYQGAKNPLAETVLRTWKDMLENALRDTASWQTKKRISYTKFQVPAWMITKSRRRSLNQWENYPMYAHKIVLKCLYVARIGQPDVLWSVNKLARSVTKWTGACDKRFARLISYINHTGGYGHYCHVGNTAHHCRYGLFHDPDFAGDLEDSKSTSVGMYVFFGSRTFVSIGWMCEKQTSVSHSSTESEIIPLDARLRMDRQPLDFWDVVIEVVSSSISTKSPKNQVRSRKLFAWSREGSHIQTQTEGKPRRWSIVACHHVRKFFSMWVSVGHFWR